MPTDHLYTVRAITNAPPRKPKKSTLNDPAGVEGAVYAQIQALRALGRTSVNTTEIADALKLPISLVNETVARLRQKGVKATK